MNQYPPLGVAAVRPLPIRYTPSVTMNRFFRPSLSDSCPKNRAPMTWPIRYQVAMSATALADMCKVLPNVRSGPTLLAMVISRPSRTQATPSAITSLVWNRDHGSRSIRAGIRLRIAELLAVSGGADIAPSFSRLIRAPGYPVTGKETCSTGPIRPTLAPGTAAARRGATGPAGHGRGSRASTTARRGRWARRGAGRGDDRAGRHRRGGPGAAGVAARAGTRKTGKREEKDTAAAPQLSRTRTGAPRA